MTTASTSATLSSVSSVSLEVERIFKLQKANQQKVADSTANDRRKKLDRLHKAVLKYRQEIRDALYKDFRKHPSEVDIAEIYAVTSDIKHTRDYLSRWMRPKQVDTPLAQIGTSAYVHYEPKGVVCVIVKI